MKALFESAIFTSYTKNICMDKKWYDVLENFQELADKNMF